jgi:hypothetical protein
MREEKGVSEENNNEVPLLRSTPRQRPKVTFQETEMVDPLAEDFPTESPVEALSTEPDLRPTDLKHFEVDEDLVIEEGDDEDVTDDDIAFGTPQPLQVQPQFIGPPTLTTALSNLNDWASRWKVSSDPYIDELNRAISTRDDLTTLAALNPLDLLPVPRREYGGNLMRIARLLLVFRNISVFAPVALTWLSINAATRGFGDFLKELRDSNPEQATQASFLDFWQNGYGYLDHFWKIQNVAFLAALIIFGIIALTFLAGALQAVANRTGAITEARMDRERTAVALRLSQALHGNKTASPQSISEALAVVLNDLTQATKGVMTAAHRMERASTGVDSLNPHLQSLNQQMSQLSARFGQDVVASVDSLVKSVNQLGLAVGGDMRGLLADVLTGLEEVNDRLNKTSIAVEYGTKQLRDDLEAIHQRLATVTNSRR